MTLTVKVDVLHNDDSTTEESFEVELRWDKAPDTGWGWWLEDMRPPAPNEFVEERIMEIAMRQMEEQENAMREAVGR